MKRQAVNPTLGELGLLPRIDADMSSLFAWLEGAKLTRQAQVLDHEIESDLPGGRALAGGFAFAQSTGRRQAQPLRTDELKELKEKFKDYVPQGLTKEALWSAASEPRSAVRALSWEKLPADAMAFYRPFHFPPFDQWGIYLLVQPLLRYHHDLMTQSHASGLFSPETLMHLVLFEVFNHEFFHHLVESTATTLEIILATQGDPQPLYLRHRQAQRLNEFKHPHAPLEEALANAYAYNALGFISRVKLGFKTASVKAYQRAVANHWKVEPAGYCDAGHYAGSGYVDGAAALLGELLSQPDQMNKVPLASIAKNVMPSGFSAFVAKPDIPTWLVGSPEELKLFETLVPAPNEAYTQLFWPYNTSLYDQFLQAKQAEEKAKRAAAKTRSS
ncbi:MAG: hypothetical protein RBT42_14040 [Aquabacterium sp.]|jgi:hypothetical protein|uniref:hypothetical protein n=1 Tax=Aquabacterium sp. TaxID=1872578 RepID=UPI002A3640A4|nr:hypothetical protein [Aquabacterium sp.]MDX9844863.1 hypothetical protein [Aquabacterium sp.]